MTKEEFEKDFQKQIKMNFARTKERVEITLKRELTKEENGMALLFFLDGGAVASALIMNG